MSKWIRDGRALGLLMLVAVSASVAEARSGSSGRSRTSDVGAFDGSWSVVIQSDSGPCDGSYRYGVEIVDGAVTHEGSTYGRVAPNGGVRVRMSLGDQRAEGVGRLSRVSGSGVWRGIGPNGECRGRWAAQRRDGTWGAGR